MKVSEIYKDSGQFLKAADIQSVQTLVIANADIDNSFDKTAIVLSFNENPKKLRLNTTNAKALAAKYGEDFSTWKGKQVVLAKVPTQYQGKTVDGIRVIS